MPELPEVETIRNQLRHGTDELPSLIGMHIHGAYLLWERTLAEPSFEEFQARIIGQKIMEIGRRGKYLLFHLPQDTMLVHLRMSGDLRVEPEVNEVKKHDRLLLNLRDSWRLAFNDARKFGRVWLVEDPKSVVGDLGPEPLAEDFTPEILHERMKSRRRLLKPLLLDQSFLAGMGNIYTDEALHLARLHPLRLSNSLTEKESRRLWEAVRSVLREGIRTSGASIDWVYRGGEFQEQFRVYGRAGEACPVCGTTIERIVVGQRGTHFCPNCQPPPEISSEGELNG